MTTQEARSEYRRLRTATTRISAKEFDRIATHIAHDIADGEDTTPAMWVQAAQQVAAGAND